MYQRNLQRRILQNDRKLQLTNKYTILHKVELSIETSTSLRSLGRITVSSNGREGNVESAIEHEISSTKIMNNTLFLAIIKKSESYNHLSGFILIKELNSLFCRHNCHDLRLLPRIKNGSYRENNKYTLIIQVRVIHK